MRYLKLFEAFVETMPKRELSDKTIDDVLEPEFFEQESDKQVTQDERGVYHISGWYVY